MTRLYLLVLLLAAVAYHTQADVSCCIPTFDFCADCFDKDCKTAICVGYPKAKCRNVDCRCPVKFWDYDKHGKIQEVKCIKVIQPSKPPPFTEAPKPPISITNPFPLTTSPEPSPIPRPTQP